MAAERGRNSANYKRMAKAFQRQCLAESARCWLCWQQIDYQAPQYDDNGFSVDHFHPVSTHPELAEVYENFRPSHLGCNVRRGNREPAFGLGELSRDW